MESTEKRIKPHHPLCVMCGKEMNMEGIGESDECYGHINVLFRCAEGCTFSLTYTFKAEDESNNFIIAHYNAYYDIVAYKKKIVDIGNDIRIEEQNIIEMLEAE